MGAVKIWTPWLLEVGAWLAPIWEPRWKQLSPNATMAPQKKLKVELARRAKARQEKAEREENAHPTMRLSAKLILRPQMSSASWRRWDGLTMTTTSFRMFTTLTWLLSTQLSLTEWMNRSSRNALPK